MTYEKKTDLDINSIQEENLKMLQGSIDDNSSSADVAGSADVSQAEVNAIEETSETSEVAVEDVLKTTDTLIEKKQDPVSIEKKLGVFQKILGSFGMFFRYVLTASFIFVVLMLFTNYSAYMTIAKSYLNPEGIAESEKNIQNSIEQSKIEINYEDEEDDNREEARAKAEEKGENKIYESKDIRRILGDIREEEISLDIEIIPFVNRLVIPKIGKNVPLIDIEQGNVEGLDELNDIFMDELEDGVVRYPGSAEPGEFGNAFIFGHSSNFPWIAGDYNDVFALLDRLEIGDEVVSYYEGQKYTYKITQKEVISPNDVSVLKRETNKKELTLMTCWPIGTTYNRLLVIGELVN